LSRYNRDIKAQYISMTQEEDNTEFGARIFREKPKFIKDIRHSELKVFIF
jgi:hypothetical protein